MQRLLISLEALPDKPVRSQNVQEFADEVRVSLPPRFKLDPVLCCRAVFGTVTKFTSVDEAQKVMGHLPEPLRELWPQPA